MKKDPDEILSELTIDELKAKLTIKQAQFPYEYVIDKNGARASAAVGYSKKTAKAQGTRLLANVYVAELVDRALEEQARRTNITADRVIEEIASIAFVKEKNIQKSVYRTADKSKCLELLAKHFRLLTENIDVNLKEGLLKKYEETKTEALIKRVKEIVAISRN